MKFTGERYVPAEQGRIRLEHLHRYAVAQKIVSGKVVLDVACGEGYGAKLLADIAEVVFGVDVAEEVIEHASATYVRPNLQFRCGNAIDLEFPDSTFDVVVSFETLEHLAEQEQLLAEIRRVLKPDGILMISTPNRPIYSEESGESNKFHVNELDFRELNDLLLSVFSQVSYSGQRLLMSSAIQELGETTSVSALWSDDGERLIPSGPQLRDPIYFVAICGSQEANLPRIGTSNLYPLSLDLVKHYVDFAKWAKAQDDVIAGCNWQIGELVTSVSRRDEQISQLTSMTAERDEQIGQLTARTAERDDQINKLTSMAAERDDQINQLTSMAGERDEQINKLTSMAAERNEQINQLTSMTAERDAQIIRLNATISECRDQLAGANALVNEHEKTLLQIFSSFSWQLTGPLRQLFSWLQGFVRQIEVRSKRKLNRKTLRSSSLRASSESIDALIERPDRICLYTSEAPTVSVIIPIYGKLNYTLRCLASISLFPPSAAFEVIVVDDCSPDDSAVVLQAVGGVRLVRNSSNVGFIHSCNAGSMEAKGRYLYFLNNDTEVTSGWLDELLQTFSEIPDAGLVGSQLIYPDGRLQEAGGIIWQDGSAWNWGNLQDPSHCAFNYSRDADYISGASIMVPRDVFKRLGMFNTLYAPAYYEDTDLAMSIRRAKLRVIYQPYSRVVHFEGISSGTDVTQGTKRFQEINRGKFVDAWHEDIRKLTPNGFAPYLSCDRIKQRHILIVDACTPTPDQDSGSLDMFNLIKILIEQNWRVHFVPFSNFQHFGTYTDVLQRMGVECVYAPFYTTLDSYLRERGNVFQICLLARTDVAGKTLPFVEKYCPSSKRIFYTVDLHFLREKREAALTSDPLVMKKAEATELMELGLMDRVNSTVVLSEVEHEILIERGKKNISVLPLIRETGCPVSTNLAERFGVVFVGGFQHLPNVDAVDWLLDEIWPEVRRICGNRSLPCLPLYIVGSKMPTRFQEVKSEDTIPVGFVADLSDVFNKVRLSIAPLRYGAGLKGKIATSYLYGIPVVGTAIAYEGMPTKGLDLVRYQDDTPRGIAELIVDLHYSNRDLEVLGTLCRDYAVEHYSKDSVSRRIECLVDALLETDMPADYKPASGSQKH